MPTYRLVDVTGADISEYRANTPTWAPGDQIPRGDKPTLVVLEVQPPAIGHSDDGSLVVANADKILIFVTSNGRYPLTNDESYALLKRLPIIADGFDTGELRDKIEARIGRDAPRIDLDEYEGIAIRIALESWLMEPAGVTGMPDRVMNLRLELS